MPADPFQPMQPEAALPPSFETELRRVLRSDVEFIELIGEDLVAAGGKRVRPLVTLLAWQALAETQAVGGQGGEGGGGQQIGIEAVRLAVCVELLHSASLLHDDLIDGADTRRGREAAYKRYGNVVSVMSGDFMLARLLGLLADLPHSPALIQVFGKAASDICEGEVLQFQVAAYGSYSLDNYWRIIYGKTAALFELAALAPALMRGAPEAQLEALRVYGRELGMAFQVRDDLLDLLGSEDELGKPVGGDLREGKATLPALLLLGSDDAAIAGELEAILLRRAAHEGDTLRARELAQGEVAAACWAEVERRLALAAGALHALPDTAARTELQLLLERVRG